MANNLLPKIVDGNSNNAILIQTIHVLASVDMYFVIPEGMSRLKSIYAAIDPETPRGRKNIQSYSKNTLDFHQFILEHLTDICYRNPKIKYNFKDVGTCLEKVDLKDAKDIAALDKAKQMLVILPTFNANNLKKSVINEMHELIKVDKDNSTGLTLNLFTPLYRITDVISLTTPVYERLILSDTVGFHQFMLKFLDEICAKNPKK
jgi:hypothetical protein